MARRTVAVLSRVARAAAAGEPELNDRDLLRRFAGEGDQAAFAAVVARHTGMVFGVCLRILHSAADAEDATQAVFLVLARKVNAVGWQPSVANWLYATARKVARNAKLAADRRAKREGAAAVPEAVTPSDGVSGRELVAALDEELDRLPPRYREPLVLCYLEGLTRDEAAARLAVPVPTLNKQLERGRKKLADALAARGCALGVVLLASATSSTGAPPPRLVQSILAAADGSPSAAAAALAEGVAVNGLLTMAKLTMLAAVGVAVLGLGVSSMPIAAEPQTPTRKVTPPDAPKPTASDTITVRVVDADGKPVAGATVRRAGRDRSEEVTEVVLGKTGADGKLVVEPAPQGLFTAIADGVGAAWSGLAPRGPEVTLKIAKPHPIKGRLTDLQGKPVSNAKVVVEQVSAPQNYDLTGAYNAFRVNPEWAGWAFAGSLDGRATGAPGGTTTDSDGRFEVTGVGRHQVVRLRFLADGIEATGVTVFADPEFAARMKPPTDAEKRANGFMTLQHTPAVYGPEFTHAARPEHLITGTVVDADTGKPVKGATVWGTTVPLRVPQSGAWRDKATATTDEKGKFTLRGLPNGVVWDLPFVPKEANRYLHVRAAGTGYLDKLAVVPNTADNTPATVEVKLRPAVVVTGTLVNKATGKPVRGEVRWSPLRANAALAENEDEDATLLAGRNGSARPSGVQCQTGADGRFRLDVPPGPGVLTASTDRDDPAAVFASPRVRNEDRKHLRKRDADPDARSTNGGRSRDDDESFDTLDVTWPLRWVNGYAVIDPAAGTKSVEMTIEFDPGAAVTVRATDPDGKPLGGVTVSGDGPLGRLTPTLGPDGIRIGGLDPKGRPQQLALLHRERKLCAVLSVRGDEKGPVVAKLRPCTAVSGRVVDHTGKPVKDALVTFQMTGYESNNLIKQKLFRDSHTVTTGADGKFAFEGMFPEVEFDLFVSLPGFRSGAGAATGITLKPGEAKVIDDIKTRDPKKTDGE